jgi:hypothetical protein
LRTKAFSAVNGKKLGKRIKQVLPFQANQLDAVALYTSRWWLQLFSHQGSNGVVVASPAACYQQHSPALFIEILKDDSDAEMKRVIDNVLGIFVHSIGLVGIIRRKYIRWYQLIL